MFKKLFLGTTEINFKVLGGKFYKIFIVEAVLFIAVIVGSLTGLLNMNLSVVLLAADIKVIERLIDNNTSSIMKDDVLSNKQVDG